MNKRTEEVLERIKESKKDKVAGKMIAVKEKDIDILIGEFIDRQEEVNKKNKIIDKMADYIVTLDIEEDICSKTENEHCDKMNFGECEDCIKQYFERKGRE